MSALSGGLYRPGIIFVLVILLSGSPSTHSAPVYDQDTTQVGEYEGGAVTNSGCYYNFQHYREGDRIITNEPCLNCTCHNRMLMCYLRVCPFTKAIGQNCKVEKRPDQCCSVITCPEVPVHLLTSTTNAPESSSTDLGFPDNYGCSIDDKFYADGAQLPIDSQNPCELCYCIRNRTTCVMQECTLQVSGCNPVYLPGVCCPVKYNCDYEEEPGTTMSSTPGLIMTTTLAPRVGEPRQCSHEGKDYEDGDLIYSTEPCQHCYCFHGDIACAVQDCGTPMQSHGKNCTALPPQEGECCPSTYECEDDLGSIDSQQILEDHQKPELPTETPTEKNDVLQATQTTLPIEESFPGADNAIPEVHEPLPGHDHETAVPQTTESATSIQGVESSSSPSEESSVPSDEVQSAVSPSGVSTGQSSIYPGEEDSNVSQGTTASIEEETSGPTEASFDTAPPSEDVTIDGPISGMVPSKGESPVEETASQSTEVEGEVPVEQPTTEASSAEDHSTEATKDTETTPLEESSPGLQESTETLPSSTVESAEPEPEKTSPTDEDSGESEIPIDKSTSGPTEEQPKVDDKVAVNEAESSTTKEPATISEEKVAATEPTIVQSSSTESEAVPTTSSEIPESASESVESSPETSTSEQPSPTEGSVEITTEFSKEPEEKTEERVTETSVIPEEGPADTTQLEGVTETKTEGEHIVTESITASSQPDDLNSPITETSDTAPTTYHPPLSKSTETPVELTPVFEGTTEDIEKIHDHAITPAAISPQEEAHTSAPEITGDVMNITVTPAAPHSDDVSVSTESDNLGTAQPSTAAPIEETSDSENIQHIPHDKAENLPTESSQETTVGSVTEGKPPVQESTTVKLEGGEMDEKEMPTKGLTLESSSEESSSSEETSSKLPSGEELEHVSGETSSEEVGEPENQVTGLPGEEIIPSETTPVVETSEKNESTEPAAVPTTEATKETSLEETSTPLTSLDEATKTSEKEEEKTESSIPMEEHSTAAQSDEKTTTERIEEESVTNEHGEVAISTKEASVTTETAVVSEVEQNTNIPMEVPSETKETSTPGADHSEATVVPSDEILGSTTAPADHSISDENTVVPSVTSTDTESGLDDQQHHLATEEVITSEPDVTVSHHEDATTAPIGSEPTEVSEISPEVSTSSDVTVSDLEKTSPVDTFLPQEEVPEHTEKAEIPSGDHSTEKPVEKDVLSEEQPTKSTGPVDEEQVTTESGPIKSDAEKTSEEPAQTTEVSDEVTDEQKTEETPSVEEAVTSAPATDDTKMAETPTKDTGTSDSLPVETEEPPTKNIDESSYTSTPEVSTVQIPIESSESSTLPDHVEDAQKTTTTSEPPESTESVPDADKTTMSSKLPEPTVSTDVIVETEKTTISSKLPESTDLVTDTETTTIMSKVPESTDVVEDTEKTTLASVVPEVTSLPTELTDIAQDTEKTTVASEEPASPEVVKDIAETPAVVSEVPSSTEQISELTTKIPSIEDNNVPMSTEKTTKGPAIEEGISTAVAPEETEDGQITVSVGESTASPSAESDKVPVATNPTEVPEQSTPEPPITIPEQEPAVTLKEPAEEGVQDTTTEGSISISTEEPVQVPDRIGESVTETEVPTVEESTTAAQEGLTSEVETEKPLEPVDDKKTEELPTTASTPVVEVKKPTEEVTSTTVPAEKAIPTIKPSEEAIPTIIPSEMTPTEEPVAHDHSTEVSRTPEKSDIDQVSTEASQTPEKSDGDKESTEATPEESTDHDLTEESLTPKDEINVTPTPEDQGGAKPFDVYGPPAGIPGEGNCLVEGQSYANNSMVPPSNPCQLSCRCASSIVQCDLVKCSPPPEHLTNCMPVHNVAAGESCCPIYSCDSVPTVDSLEAVNQMRPDGHLPSSQVPSEGTTVESIESVPTVSDENLPTGTSELAETESHTESPVSESEEPLSTSSPATSPIHETSATFEASSQATVSTEETPAAPSLEETQQPEEIPTKMDKDQKEETQSTVSSDTTSTEKSALPEVASTTGTSDMVKEESTEPAEDITKGAAVTELPTESSDEPSKVDAQTIPVHSDTTEPTSEVEEPAATESELETIPEQTEMDKHDESSTEIVSSSEPSVGDSELTAQPDYSQSTETIHEPEDTSAITTEGSIVDRFGTEAVSTSHEVEHPQEQTTTSEEETVAPITETSGVVEKEYSTTVSVEVQSTTVSIEGETSLPEVTPIVDEEKPEAPSTSLPSHTEPQQTEEPIATSTAGAEMTQEPVDIHVESTPSTTADELQTSTDAQLETSKPSVSTMEDVPAVPGEEKDEETMKPPHEPTIQEPTSSPVEPQVDDVEKQSINDTEVPSEHPMKVDETSTVKDESESQTVKEDFTVTPISAESPVETTPAASPTSPSIEEDKLSTEEVITVHEPIETVTSAQETETPEETSSVSPTTEQTTPDLKTETSPPIDHSLEEHEVTTTIESAEDQTKEPIDGAETEAPIHPPSEEVESPGVSHPDESTSEEEPVTTVSPSVVDQQTEVAVPSSSSETSGVQDEGLEVTEAPVAAEQPSIVPAEESTPDVSTTIADVTDEQKPDTTASPILESSTIESDKEITQAPVDSKNETPDTTEIPSGTSPAGDVTEVSNGTDATIKESTTLASSTAVPVEDVHPGESSSPSVEHVTDASTAQPSVPIAKEQEPHHVDQPAEHEDHSTPSGQVTEPSEPAEPAEGDVHQYPQEPDVHEHTLEPDVHEHTLEPDAHQHPQEPDVQEHTQEPDAHQHPQEPDVHQYTQEPDVHQHPQEPDVQVSESPIVPEEHDVSEVQHNLPPEEETPLNDTSIATEAGHQGDLEYPEVPAENEDNPHFPVNSGSYLNPDEDYDEDDQAVYGPGTCRYGGKVYVSAQQIPRDDPCDFCFCFRSDIICLQQSCPPPIPGCHEEPIRGFCCPRYECPVSMATSVNLTTTTTTTTTTLPPHFLSHAYKGAARQSGCQIRGQAYSVGQPIKSASGPCLQCTCGGDGNMKCDPRVCSPEPTLRQMIAAATARRRR